ncbi:MAG: hypothetical protein IID03_02725 [Candidatus Dadabacteria bacterium]|nr:hypothetical protein [Candidatus Dadabacteria bacterium]
MTDVAINKTDLLRKLCGILAGWLVFLITFFLIAISFAVFFELLDNKFQSGSYINLAVSVVIFGLSILAGVYTGVRFGKYLTKLLKTKSNRIVIFILIALIVLVIISFPSFFIYTKFE